MASARDISRRLSSTATQIVDHNPRRKALILSNNSAVGEAFISPSPRVDAGGLAGIILQAGVNSRPLVLEGEAMKGIVQGRLFGISTNGDRIGIVEIV